MKPTEFFPEEFQAQVLLHEFLRLDRNSVFSQQIWKSLDAVGNHTNPYNPRLGKCAVAFEHLGHPKPKKFHTKGFVWEGISEFAVVAPSWAPSSIAIAKWGEEDGGGKRCASGVAVSGPVRVVEAGDECGGKRRPGGRNSVVLQPLDGLAARGGEWMGRPKLSTEGSEVASRRPDVLRAFQRWIFTLVWQSCPHRNGHGLQEDLGLRVSVLHN